MSDQDKTLRNPARPGRPRRRVRRDKKVRTREEETQMLKEALEASRIFLAGVDGRDGFPASGPVMPSCGPGWLPRSGGSQGGAS